MGIPTRSETALKMNMLTDHLCSHHDEQLVSLPGFLRFVTAYVTARNEVEKAEDGSTKSPKRSRLKTLQISVSQDYLLFIIPQFRRSWIMIIHFFWAYFWVQRKKLRCFLQDNFQLAILKFWDVSCAIGREGQSTSGPFAQGVVECWFIECLQLRLKKTL